MAVALFDRIDDAHVVLNERQRHLVAELRNLLPLTRAGRPGKVSTAPVRRQPEAARRGRGTGKGRTARA